MAENPYDIEVLLDLKGSNDSPKEHFPVQNEMHSAFEQSQLAFNMQQRMISALAARFYSTLLCNQVSFKTTQSLRKARTVFTEFQLNGLETRFQNQHYLSTPERLDLASSLNLSDAQVKTWFQNRRMKFKRQNDPAFVEAMKNKHSL